ncbi:MAG: DUF6483 family protein [Clostridium sp.]|jgi:hypothetical protein|uniref:DUF6483 family protein n=1 Tax=Clostridium sp. TaxID=1506 RepID=UPI0025B9C22B|nr:DUF6483 family protein [Clostridium sp.]MCH3963406.1 DUF6483 family protein [Clostridium sp.]MCI1716726.1 DUF6483 family protein [Clostridium sp.]MCI1801090.1 DUF6483 family protein [Clostridium sp.]MCI1814912.1 DUF6483 family protein [Clostridium sp.]MCI1871813.1 DUF6483 family protein [Clostridium sp.]
MYEEDYIKRLIKSIAEMAVAIVAGRDTVQSNIRLDKFNISISQDELLEMMVRKYVSDGKINKAQDMIIDAIKSHRSKQNYKIALSFYEEINKWDEDKLSKCNFSKQKILEGLKNIKKLYTQPPCTRIDGPI